MPGTGRASRRLIARPPRASNTARARRGASVRARSGARATLLVGVPKVSSSHTPTPRAAWERLSRVTRYEDARGICLREDRVRLPTGAITSFTMLHSTDGVGVLPLDADDQVTLVGQVRYPHRGLRWEIPTGSVGAGETPEEAARRELREEARLEARVLTPLLAYHPNTSLLAETVHLYLARELAPGAGERDPTELLEVRRLPFERVLAMVLGGEISDSPSVIATLLVA